MADVKDRVTEHPHRYKLIPVPGEPDTYDLAVVPGEVTEPGTPINRQLFVKLTEEIDTEMISTVEIPWARRAK